MRPLLTLAAAALAVLARITPAATPTAPPAQGEQAGRSGPLPSLAEAYRGQFLVGASVSPGQVIVGDTYRFIRRQFDVITPENDLKPLLLARTEGSYDFRMADQVVDWARKNGVKVRGHCLVWHQQAAPWMFTKDGKPVSRELLIERMRKYIHDVVGHYQGKIWAWDVVNEAFAPGDPKVDTERGWRRSEWYQIIGPEYVELAFRFAHEADPDALLFYNDYDTENPAKRDLIVALVRDLQKKGVPIHGIGHQAHLYLSRPAPAQLEDTIKAVARLGLRNHVTELDVSLRERDGAPLDGDEDELLSRQASRYADFFRMFRRNRERIEAVVLWGITDEMSWHPLEEPLLFSEMEPKPAFWAVVDEAARPLQ